MKIKVDEIERDNNASIIRVKYRRHLGDDPSGKSYGWIHEEITIPIPDPEPETNVDWRKIVIDKIKDKHTPKVPNTLTVFNKDEEVIIS